MKILKHFKLTIHQLSSKLRKKYNSKKKKKLKKQQHTITMFYLNKIKQLSCFHYQCSNLPLQCRNYAGTHHDQRTTSNAIGPKHTSSNSGDIKLKFLVKI